MTATLSDEIRSVWTDGYKLHEKYQDIDGEASSWMKFSNEIVMTVAKHSGAARQLAQNMYLALYEYLGEEQKKREEAARLAPEQMTVEEILNESKRGWTGNP